MPLPTLRPPRIVDPGNQSQREVKTAVKQLDQPGVRKVTVTGVKLGTSTVKVPHQLGKIPTAWIIVDRDSPAIVWRDIASTMTGDVIPLVASASVTVTLQFW